MRVAKVVGMGYDGEETVEDFGAEYYAISPPNKSQAEILLFVRTDDKSGLGLSIYSNEKSCEASNTRRAEDITKDSESSLLRKALRVKGDIMMSHILTASRKQK